MKVKLTRAPYKTLTGEFCSVQFEDGVSVYEVDTFTADRIAALTAAVDAETGEPACSNARAERARHARQLQVRKAVKQDAKIPSVDQSAHAPTTEKKVVSVPTYTREDLEALADEKGIEGLRELSKPLGVNGKAIAGIIDSLMLLKQNAESQANASEDV